MPRLQNGDVVIIVGAGSIGLCTAYHLAKQCSEQALHVTIKVLEVFGEPFAGASSTCTGCLHYGFPEPQSPPLLPLGKYSFDLWASEAGDDSFTMATGYRAQSSYGINLGSGQRLDVLPDWVKSEPNWDVDTNVLGARTATVNPIGLGRWLSERCRSMGVEIEVGTEVVDVRLSANNCVQAVTCVKDDETAITIHCTELLLACGAWTPDVFGKLFPSSSLKLQWTTDAGDWASWKNPCPTTESSTAYVSFANLVGDKLEFAGRNDGTIWACGRRNLTADLPAPGHRQDPDERMISDLVSYAQKWVNLNCDCLGSHDHDIQLVAQGRAFRPATKSGLPIFDEFPSVALTERSSSISRVKGSPSGVFICWGHGSYGLTLGMGSGRVMSQLMLGEEPDIDISEFSLEAYRAAALYR
ncbi:hypothetical protein F5Y14DRAFT_440819 [Nemania sp. NC0429]|nr:hypothetical protein F5Y14DRAFT_440819 [Nemania sp. NC0429]